MSLRFQALLLLVFQCAVARHIIAVDLKPETVEAFSRYVQATEKHIDQQLARPDRLLYIDGLADPSRTEILTSLKNGQTFMQRLETRNDSGQVMSARGGLIHHWIGDVFIPGVSLVQVLDLVEDNNHHQDIYKPDVVRSRIVTRDGNDFKVGMRFRKKKVITVTLNTEHDVHYSELDSTHWYSRSVSTRIAEVEHADKPDEREKPVGHDGGFL